MDPTAVGPDTQENVREFKHPWLVSAWSGGSALSKYKKKPFHNITAINVVQFTLLCRVFMLLSLIPTHQTQYTYSQYTHTHTHTVLLLCGVFTILSLTPTCWIVGAYIIAVGIIILVMEIPFLAKSNEYAQKIGDLTAQFNYWQKGGFFFV